MTKRAVVLGAGASVAYEDSPTGVRMPLATTFHEALRLPELQNPWVLLHNLFLYLEHFKNVDPVPYLLGGFDLEELHSEIYEAALETLGRPITRDTIIKFGAHHQLIFLFAYVVNVIQNGPPSTIHRRIARGLRSTDGVITFNWDTLMDRALATDTEWRPDSGYGIVPHQIFRDGWHSPTPSDCRLRLWKLHGSSNWLTSHEQIEDGKIILIQTRPEDTLHVYESATSPYPCHAGRFMPGHQPFSYGYYPPNLQGDVGRRAKPGRVFVRWRFKFPWVQEGVAAASGLVSMPMIIPPVKAKAYDRFGSLFHSLWRGAEDLLATADDITVIGYSFPRTDHRSRQLFAEAFRRRSTLPRVTILDPAPERAATVFRDLGLNDQTLTVIRDRLTSSTPIERLIAE